MVVAYGHIQWVTDDVEVAMERLWSLLQPHVRLEYTRTPFLVKVEVCTVVIGKLNDGNCQAYLLEIHVPIGTQSLDNLHGEKSLNGYL